MLGIIITEMYRLVYIGLKVNRYSAHRLPGAVM